jgi:hypothetical protein
MRRLALLTVTLIALSLALAACGGGKPGSTTQPGLQAPLPGNSELVVGPNRFAIGLIDENNERIFEQGNAVHLRFFNPDGVLASDHDATFIWAIQDVSGFWATDVDFDNPGKWTALVTVSRGAEDAAINVDFNVVQRGFAPKIGDQALPADNLTLAQNPNIKRISTDPQPDQAFYQMTVTQAIAAQKPFVVVFATPLFCSSQFCGPVLDNVKAVAPDFAGEVNFIHIEPYDLTEEGTLVLDAEGGPVVAQPTNDWNLQSEPWVFVVAADGTIAARFESAVSVDELRTAFQQVVGS